MKPEVAANDSGSSPKVNFSISKFDILFKEMKFDKKKSCIVSILFNSYKLNQVSRKSHNKTRFWTNGGVFSRSVYKTIYCKQKLDPGDFNKYFLQTR